MTLGLIRASLSFIALLGSLSSVGAQLAPIFKPINPDDPKGLELGPGVPRTVDTKGNVIGIDTSFTSRQFQEAAVRLMLFEASSVARELQLSEDLPITETNLTAGSVVPFGDYYANHTLGNICTKNYAYIFARENKFNEVDVANYDETCIGLEKYQLPKKALDFKTPYLLASQWMASASIDINALNRDCKVQVAVSPLWNGLSSIGDIPRKHFVPIYDVSWLSPQNQSEHYGDVAFVELYLPDRKLIQFCIQDSKYISRKPLVFTNLASLFPGTARISVFTNRPAHTGPPLIGAP